MTSRTTEPESPYVNAFRIADGLDRTEIDRRAKQAFDYANECRVKYRDLVDTQKRVAAVDQALGWRKALRYLDETHRAGFIEDEYRKWDQHWVQRIRKASSVVNLRRWYWIVILSYGVKPFRFYKGLPSADSYE